MKYKIVVKNDNQPIAEFTAKEDRDICLRALSRHYPGLKLIRK
jgi:hypothetical protein|tara:strand:+ start:2466 stop:2594 length:129 start_codon:yes stop_codon:yes gene_type:complete